MDCTHVFVCFCTYIGEERALPTWTRDVQKPPDMKFETTSLTAS